jgi:hypothetical protein
MGKNIKPCLMKKAFTLNNAALWSFGMAPASIPFTDGNVMEHF